MRMGLRFRTCMFPSEVGSPQEPELLYYPPLAMRQDACTCSCKIASGRVSKMVAGACVYDMTRHDLSDIFPGPFGASVIQRGTCSRGWRAYSCLCWRVAKRDADLVRKTCS